MLKRIHFSFTVNSFDGLSVDIPPYISRNEHLHQSQRPIAIFDSGAGGLTVLHELLVALPQENFLYFADTKHFPYGEKTVDQLQQFACAIVDELVRREAKLIVIACNSATAAAAEAVRVHLKHVAQQQHSTVVPLVTVIDPEVELAVGLTQNQRIGVLATPATVGSTAYERAIHQMKPSIEVQSVACPDLAAIIQHEIPVTEREVDIVRSYCDPLKHSGVDTVILGCTHYPLVRPMLQRLLGPNVQLVASGSAIAKRVEGILASGPFGFNTASSGEGDYLFLCTGDTGRFASLASRFLQLPVDRVEYVNLKVKHESLLQECNQSTD